MRYSWWIFRSFLHWLWHGNLDRWPDYSPIGPIAASPIMRINGHAFIRLTKDADDVQWWWCRECQCVSQAPDDRGIPQCGKC